MSIKVTKRDGRKEILDITKLQKVTQNACEGLSGVSSSELELASALVFFNGITTNQINETLIKSAADLISEDKPNYDFVAGRLVNHQIRKMAYNSFTPPTLYDHVVRIVELGFYTSELLEWYTKEELDLLNEAVQHERDWRISYAGMEQFRSKYLVKDRTTGHIFETPQFLYMLVAATLFHNDKGKNLAHVINYYECLSNNLISIPTPILAGCRTPQKQFSSCVLINVGDSLDSINGAANAIVKYVSQKAGIGVNVGRIRSKGSKVRNGDTAHTGIVPFMKYLNAAVKSCSQGGVRNGAATYYFPVWHPEIEDLITLKNNQGTEETRIRNADFCVQLHGVFYRRFIEGGVVSLFDPNTVPDLYEAYFAGGDSFETLYSKYESKKLYTKQLPARELFTKIAQERAETGRIYIMNVDNVNNQSLFEDPIYQSNLCCEIALPNKPLDATDPDEGLIALCTLSAINLVKVDDDAKMEFACTYAVRALNHLIDYQKYPVEAAWAHTDMYRPLGVGVTGLAYWLAKRGLSYEGDTETLTAVDRLFESFSYYLIKASNEYSKDRDVWVEDVSQYEYGLFPFEKRAKKIDTLVPHETTKDWEALRDNLQEYGIANSTLMALMPCESSSQLLGSPNGVEPILEGVSIKQSEGSLPQIAPEWNKLKSKYNLKYALPSPTGYLKIMAVIQKWVDQTISANTFYNPENFENKQVSTQTVLRDMIMFYGLGGKTLYYHLTKAGTKDKDDSNEKPIDNDENDCQDGVCKL